MGYQRECIHVWLRSQDSGTKTTPSSNPVPTSREFTTAGQQRAARQGFQPLGIPWLSSPSRTSCCSIPSRLKLLDIRPNSTTVFPLSLFPFSLSHLVNNNNNNRCSSSSSFSQLCLLALLSGFCSDQSKSLHTSSPSPSSYRFLTGLHLPSSLSFLLVVVVVVGLYLFVPLRLHFTVLSSTSLFLFFHSSYSVECFIVAHFGNNLYRHFSPVLSFRIASSPAVYPVFFFSPQFLPHILARLL